MDDSFKQIIDSSASLLVLLPKNPNFDEVAAGLSLYLALKEKKETTVASPAPMLVEFNRLVGVDRITNELGSKNLVIRFADYKAADIERVGYDIESSEFKLTVVPKQGLSAPKKDQVILAYSGVSADTVILVGGDNVEQFPALTAQELAGARKIHVSNRTLAAREDGILSFEQPTSSISELAGHLIKGSGLPIDADCATNLLSGIAAGSQDFKADGVSADTFQLVADLLRLGGKREIKQEQEAVGTLPFEPVAEEPAPSDWLTPKIFKGTSVS